MITSNQEKSAIRRKYKLDPTTLCANTMGTEKVMSYLEKSVGSTAFFKCEACPYMALAEDDIKFHLFTAHPELARRNGLADNIHIPCPGCAAVFSADATLRTHLRTHHRMGIKDVKKMVRSLVHIALKHAKLKKEAAPPAGLDADVKMPQVIEIVPDTVSAGANLPKGVAYISVDELNKMSTPNFEKVDPKDIIQEASINIVYTEDVSTQYINVSDPGPSSTSQSMLQMGSVPPDLISSIQPHLLSTLEPSLTSNMLPPQPNPPHILKPEELNQEASKQTLEPTNVESKTGTACMVNGCQICLKEEKNLLYHRRCHQGGKLVCVECGQVLVSSEALHTHLWKLHAVDLELPTCPLCGYKTYRRYRLINVHMKCHGGDKTHVCGVCSKSFKSAAQLSKHRAATHAGRVVRCELCPREFRGARRLALHVAAVHHKVRPFRCEQCPYRAARKDDLKRHLRAHTGDKPYACSRCDFRAADHNSMRRHTKTHSKSGLYECPHCPYTTIQSTVFATHLLAAHPEAGDVHCCPCCAYKSVSREQLAAHLATHGPAPEPAPPAAAPPLDLFHCDSPSELGAPAAPYEAGGERTAEGGLMEEEAPAPALPSYIRLPPPHSILLTPADKISLAASRSGPIIAPTQMLPAPASSPTAEEGAPRKKPKISVKSNLILKGPDQDSMFQQQQMAFQRLEGQFGLGAPVTFNNLISTQFLQLPPEGQFEVAPPAEPAYVKLERCKSEVQQDEAARELAYLLGEQYALLAAPDVIEIDDNSDDSKVLPRFDAFPLDSYLAHDLPLLEPELPTAEPEPAPVPEACLQGRRDPMMNPAGAARATKINVKNIELMKN